MGEQFVLTIETSVELGTMHAVEITREPEMLNDAFGKDARLARAEGNPVTMPVQLAQDFLDALVERVFAPTHLGVAHAVVLQSLLDLEFGMQCQQGLPKRWTDQGTGLFKADHREPEPLEGVVQATMNPERVVAQGAIQIEKEGRDCHLQCLLNRCLYLPTVAEKFLEGRVLARIEHNSQLLSLRFAAAIEPFESGQFLRVGTWIHRADGSASAELRPYSLVNAPHEDTLEIVFNVIPAEAGGLVSPALARLQVGDTILVGPRANGFFTPSEVPKAEVLWALATGTGIGPFLSMLACEPIWQKFERIVLVQAVRHAADLIYRERIAQFAQCRGARFQHIRVVSREEAPGALRGRIPALIASGALEAATSLNLSVDNSHVMLCGNPDMLHDTTAVLEARGLTRHRPRKPGQFSTEAYW